MSSERLSKRDELKEVIKFAENSILKRRYSSKRKKKIKKSIENAYAVLNRQNSSDKEIDSVANKIKVLFMKRGYLNAAILFSIAFILAGLFVLIVFKAI